MSDGEVCALCGATVVTETLRGVPHRICRGCHACDVCGGPTRRQVSEGGAR